MSTTGLRRVLRVPATWPVVHLEESVPPWSGLRVDGLVRHARRFTLADLTALGAQRRAIALHCVWGWSRPDSEWDGVGLDAVLELAGPLGDHVTVSSASETYSACLPLEDASEGFLGWARDGDPLPQEAGGPLRYLAPSAYWAYKGVKWAARVTVVDGFTAGFWESKVSDPVGLIPDAVERP